MYDEKELIRQCLSGNSRAEKQLYDRYSAGLFGLCLRYANCREEAEDMLVSGFTRIFQRLSEYGGTGSFEGWMRRVMVRNAIDTVRKRHAMVPEDMERLTVTEDTAADGGIQQKLEAMDAMKALQQLPPAYRTIFNLFVMEGCQHKEIARIMGMNASTVRVYFNRAKKMLQELLEEKR